MFLNPYNLTTNKRQGMWNLHFDCNRKLERVRKAYMRLLVFVPKRIDSIIKVV